MLLGKNTICSRLRIRTQEARISVKNQLPFVFLGILKVTTSSSGRKPPVPSRQSVNEKLTGRQGGQQDKQQQQRVCSVSDDSGRESDVKTTSLRHRDSGNSSLGNILLWLT
jgi:hypothetical protein